MFAQVVAVTGTGLPERSGSAISIGYVTAYGVSRQTGLPVSVVVGAGRRLTEPGLTIAGTDGASWRTDSSRFAGRPISSEPRDRARASRVAVAIEAS